MIKAFNSYTLLTGSHGKRGSIWRGPDHLLIVEGRGMLLPLSEHYRRIDYQNVQALTSMRTSRYAWLAVLLAVLAVLLALGLYASLDEAHGLQLFAGVPFVLVLTLLILHLAKGPTSRCTLQTAVMTLRLRPLTRWRKALKVLTEIEQLCRQYQGQMPEGDSIPQEMAPAPQPSFLQISSKPAWPGSKLLLSTGGLVALWGVVVCGEMFVPGVVYTMVNAALWMAAFVLIIMSLVRALRYQTPAGLLPVLWTSLIMQLVIALGAYMGLIAMGFISGFRSQAGIAGGGFEAGALFSRLASLSLADTGNAGWLVVMLGGCVLGLGVAMSFYGGWRNHHAQPSEGTVPPAEPPALS